MPVLRIHAYPEPVLNIAAAPIDTIDGTTARLASDMAETMYDAPGIGLAAPQVGASQRLIVLDVRKQDEPAGKHLIKLINPVIAEREGEVVWEEGCLSVPNFSSDVTRAQRVLVKAWTLDQQEIQIEAADLFAVALQHEIDHLDGKLFLARLSRLKRELYTKRRKKLVRQGRGDEVSSRRVLL